MQENIIEIGPFQPAFISSRCCKGYLSLSEGLRFLFKYSKLYIWQALL